MQRFAFPAITACAALGLAGSALARDDAVETRLRPYSEVPAVSSAASGRFKASVDKDDIRYELSYRDLQGEVRQAHIHIGQKDVNGGIMVFLCQTSANPDPTGLAPQCPGPNGGTVTGVIRAANVIGPAGQGIDPGEFDEVRAAIRAGVAYVNVHSTLFPGGEVRGQLRDD